MRNLGKIEAAAVLKELGDPNKAASKMLSSIKEKIPWEMTSEEEKLHRIFLHANNNQLEFFW